MKTTAQLWGHSVAIRIPKAIAVDAGIAPGVTVEVTREGDSVIIRGERHPRFALESLMEAVTPENRHGEIDWGSPVGREVW